MSHPVLIPADNEPRPGIPKGAALLQTRQGYALVHAERGVRFAECCDRAAKGRGDLIRVDFDTVHVGLYDGHEGELRPDHRAGRERLERWTGRRMYRNELVADDNRADRRASARNLARQGRYDEALKRDPRMGF